MCKFNMFITAVCVLFLIKLRWPKNKSIYDKAFVCFGQNSEKMVLERAKHSSSTQNVLAQYLRKILIELPRQEKNGFESVCFLST